MIRLLAPILLVLLLCVSTYGQTVDGGTGADGPFNPPSQVPTGTPPAEGNCTMSPGCTVTVPLPADGIFNFTTVTIGPFVTVKFRRNAANTPVFIRARGNVTINGAINVNGQDGVRGTVAAKGGPGGFSGGIGVPLGGTTNQGGAGSGPGGGGGGMSSDDGDRHCGSGGGFGSGGGGPQSGVVYGILELLPLIGGSGGGGSLTRGSVPGNNGGGGGGALLIASSGVIDLGSGTNEAITANGGNGENIDGAPGGGGSGGAIRLVASIIRGSRRLSARGGSSGGGAYCRYLGGGGRIRLEAFDFPYTGNTDPLYTSGLPGPVFPPITPRVRLVSVAGVTVSGQTAEVSTADLTLPPNFTNPVPVVLEATNVPSGIQARVIVAPQLGAGARTITPVTLTGTAGQPKRGTANVTLPTRDGRIVGVGIISAVIDSVVPEPSMSNAAK